jgi:hypothetical protein
MSAVRKIRTATIAEEIVTAIDRASGETMSYYEWTVRNHDRTVVLRQRPNDIDACDAFVPPLRPSDQWDDSGWSMLKKIREVTEFLA